MCGKMYLFQKKEEYNKFGLCNAWMNYSFMLLWVEFLSYYNVLENYY